MPKPVAAKEPQQVTTTVYRVERATDASGKVVSGKWNCVEMVVTGVVTSRKLLSDAKPLPIAREVFSRAMAARTLKNPEDQQW